MEEIENEQEYRFLVSEEAAAGLRLDQFLTEQIKSLSRSRIQQLIKDNTVFVDGENAKAKSKLVIGNEIVVHVPSAEPMEEVKAQCLPLDILFEDEDLIVLNKISGMVVHPAAGNPDGTLVNALLHHCEGQLSGIGGVLRPGIVHRLDKDTSGCLVAAKNDRAHQELSRQFSERETSKLYHCVVQGVPSQTQGRIENRIGRHPVNRQKMAVLEPPKGKEAITDYRVLHACEENDKWAYVECLLHTGRTHQIRVHMKSLGCPILGDEIYAQPSRQLPRVTRLMLHASQLGFTHPRSGEAMKFTAPLPEDFAPFAG